MAWPTASLSVAGGTPQLANVNPVVFSQKMITKFYQSSVVPQIATLEYEGEIKDIGSEVEIRGINDAEITDYTKNMDTTPKNVDPTVVSLSINKGHMFFQAIDSVDRLQSDLDYLEKIQEDGNKRIMTKVDDNVFNAAPIYSDAVAANKGATAGVESADINLGVAASGVVFTSANALDIIIERCTVVADEQNWPDDERWITLPSWACARTSNSDIKNASLTGDSKSTLRNSGIIGEINGWMIIKSNSIKKDANSEYHCTFGHKSAFAFAAQVKETTYFKQLERRAGQAVRSIMVYGYKAINTKGIGDLLIKKS